MAALCSSEVEMLTPERIGEINIGQPNTLYRPIRWDLWCDQCVRRHQEWRLIGHADRAND